MEGLRTLQPSGFERPSMLVVTKKDHFIVFALRDCYTDLVFARGSSPPPPPHFLKAIHACRNKEASCRPHVCNKGWLYSYTDLIFAHGGRATPPPALLKAIHLVATHKPPCLQYGMGVHWLTHGGTKTL